MGRVPEVTTDVGAQQLKRNSAIIPSLVILGLGAPTPTEQEYSELADKLEKNPPTNLTPDSLSVVIQILRGEKPHSEPTLAGCPPPSVGG